jgi:hypothetical protein
MHAAYVAFSLSVLYHAYTYGYTAAAHFTYMYTVRALTVRYICTLHMYTAYTNYTA